MKKTNVILGVIGSDCHSVGNRLLSEFFMNAGFNVINLGVMVSQNEFISTAIESDARAILVSSLYGHGLIDCAGFRDKCVEKGLDRIVLYVGGNLVVGKTPFAEVEKKFKDMGFDRVFPPDADLNEAAKFLKHDIEK